MRDDDIVRGPGPAVTLTHEVAPDSPVDSHWVRELLPEPVVAEGSRVGMVFWHASERAPRSDHRSIEALEWKEVEPNYPRATRERLVGLMRAFVPGRADGCCCGTA